MKQINTGEIKRVMPKFKFLSEVGGGLAFEAFGKSERELLQNSAMALEETMVDTKTVRSRESTALNIRDTSLNNLLFNLLEHLIFLKSAKQLLFRNIKLGFEKQKKSFVLQGFAYGERVDDSRHKLKVDVRGVSKDLFKVEKGEKGLHAQVILEV